MQLEKYQKLVIESLKKYILVCDIKSVSMLTPDASSRLYFRIELVAESLPNRLIAMLFLSTKSPESGGSVSVCSDQAVMQLGKFLYQNDISVPEIFYQDLEHSIILIEDLGDISLAESFQTHKNIDYYKAAIDQILKIQNIKPEQDFFPYKREFGFKQYRLELDEILDFSLINITAVERDELSKQFDKLSNQLNLLPKVLVHRDFHSWNLMLDRNNKIRVIDYQDALMATKYYDLVALLNDRDTDQILGEQCYLSLLEYYYYKIDKPEKFLEQYCLISLQRDLKVVGRFSKLDQIKIGANYSKWIPGTLKRVARTLDFLGPEYQVMKNILTIYYPDYFSSAHLIELSKLKLRQN